MIHYIWSMLMLLSILYAFFTGNLSLMTEAVMDGAKEAVNLCIVMAAVVGLWSGIMEIGVHSGVIDRLSRWMNPFLTWMFPDLSEKGDAKKYIASNLAANILGLGWAATPAGLRAMEKLSTVNQKKETASKEMCTFLLLNISAIQVIPLTMIVYRSQYGSGVPAAIVVPGLIATMASAFTAVIYARAMCRREKKQHFK